MENVPEGFIYTDDLGKADIVISVLYEHLFKPEYLLHRRVYNFHPGRLPYYRGAGAFSWEIINGEKTSAITLHEVDDGIDTGPIIAVAEFPIGNTAEETHDRAETVFLEFFQSRFRPLLSGAAIPKPQSTSGHLYTRANLSEALDLTKYVRAFTFKGKPNAFYIDRKGKRHELKY